MSIPIYKPYINKYKKSAIKAIEDGWISNLGDNVKLATEKLKKVLNIPYCILMSNGTCATHCLFLAIKYKYPQIDTIYVPNNVYIAVWNCAIREYNKSSLIVLPINIKTWNMTIPTKFKKRSAIVIVHNLGNIIDISKNTR